MPRKIKIETAFKILRQLPPEISITQVEEWLRQAPPVNMKRHNYWTWWLSKQRFWN